jgi:hypothetical protein
MIESYWWRFRSPVQRSVDLQLVVMALLVTSSMLMQSCSDHLRPGSFWTEHSSANRTELSEEYGGYGGHVVAHWKAEDVGTFLREDIEDLATDHGWTLVDTHEVPETVVRHWVDGGEPYFPLWFDGFQMDVTAPDYLVPLNRFPLWMHSDLVLLEFETTVILIKPGTDEVTEKNGFVLLSQDGSEMSVYFLWGE